MCMGTRYSALASGLQLLVLMRCNLPYKGTVGLLHMDVRRVVDSGETTGESEYQSTYSLLSTVSQMLITVSTTGSGTVSVHNEIEGKVKRHLQRLAQPWASVSQDSLPRVAVSSRTLASRLALCSGCTFAVCGYRRSSWCCHLGGGYMWPDITGADSPHAGEVWKRSAWRPSRQGCTLSKMHCSTPSEEKAGCDHVIFC